METNLEPVVRNSVSDEIIKQLIMLINTGKLKPGNKLPSEREMMEKFQVSRSSVREALHALTVIGLLETFPGAGTFVSKQLTNLIGGQLEWSILLGNQELVEINEVREPLQIQAAGLAAERATAESIEQFRQAIEAYAESIRTGEGYFEQEQAVHLTIAQMAGNSTLLRFLQTFEDLLYDYRKNHKIGFSLSRDTVNEYKEILAAIENSDSRAARLSMARHLQKSKRQALIEQINENAERVTGSAADGDV